MSRSQAVIIALASFLIVGMYLLPKAIVKGKKQSTQSTNLSQKGQQNKNPATSGNDDHNQPSLSKQQLTQITGWKNAIGSSTNKEKKVIFADSIANLFKSANLFDSAAHYTAQISEWNPSPDTWMKAGDSYLFAARFSIDRAKVESFTKGYSKNRKIIRMQRCNWHKPIWCYPTPKTLCKGFRCYYK